MALAVKKKKRAVPKAVPVNADEFSYVIDGRSEPTNKDMNLAIISAVDDPKGWEKRSGKISKAMPRIAKWALSMDIMHHGHCHQCGRKRPDVPKDERFLIHPESELCVCRMPFRMKKYTYIPGWNTVPGMTKLLNAVMSGDIECEDPVYQHPCEACRKTLVIVRAGPVACDILKYNAHRKKYKCDRCKLLKMHASRSSVRVAPPGKGALTVPLAELIDSPKEGPEGRFNRPNKKKKGPSVPQQPTAASPVEVSQPITSVQQSA